MPQLLSNVRRNARVVLWPSTEDRVLGLLASHIVALSSQVDHELSLLLVHVLGANATPALAMFDEFDSQKQQMRLLRAAARAELGDKTKRYRVFDAVLRAVMAAQSDRHKLAHWIWGHSPDIPNVLLLADPKALRIRKIARQRLLTTPIKLSAFLQNGDAEQQKRELTLTALYEADPKTVLIYRDEDLNRAMRDLLAALSILDYFRYYLTPLKPNRLLALSVGLSGLGTSAGALKRLNSVDQFRTAFRPSASSKKHRRSKRRK